MPDALPELQPFLAAARSTSLDRTLPVADLRAAANAGVVAAGALVRPPVQPVAVTEHRCPTPHGEMDVRVYRPDSAPAMSPVHVHLHGGGWWMGSLDTAEAMCRELAAAAGLVVVAADYGLAPERPWPVAPEQCVAMIGWLHDSAGELGLDASSLSLGGESAGANLAAVVGLELRDQLVAQWLDVPAFDLTLPETESSRSYGVGFGLDVDDVRQCLTWYVGASDARDPRVSPAFATSLRGLPATLITVAELDSMRDQGVAFAAMLATAGVDVTLRISEGHLHGTTWLTALTASAGAWHDEGVGFLRRVHGLAHAEAVA